MEQQATLGYTPIESCKEVYVLLSAMGGSFGDCVLVVPELFQALEDQSLDDVPPALLNELAQKQNDDPDDPDARIEALKDRWADMASQELICLISNLEHHLAQQLPDDEQQDQSAHPLLRCAFTTSISGLANHAREHGVVVLGERFD